MAADGSGMKRSEELRKRIFQRPMGLYYEDTNVPNDFNEAINLIET